ncbi:MAG: holo-ACP synthase [Dehalococcoidia bacterium]
MADMSANGGPHSAVGVDIIENERVRAALERFGERFLRRVYSPVEAAFCRGRVHELAARFAAKEAVMKALGTGARGVAWREIEVLPNRRGKPLVYLYGRAKERAERIGLEGLDVSMSHSREYAVAMVVGQAGEPEPDREGWRRTLIGILRQRGLLGEGQDLELGS